MHVQLPSLNRVHLLSSTPLRSHATTTRTSMRLAHIAIRSALSTEVDAALAKPEEEALKDLRSLRDSGKLAGFGNGRQIPKRIYTLELNNFVQEMRLNKIEPTALLSPTDETVNGVSTIAQASALAGVAALYFGLNLTSDQLLTGLAALTFAYFTDQVANGGGLRALALDSLARVVNGEYSQRIAMHEAGHFLVAYLLGTAPKEYTLSAVDAWKR